MKNLDLIKRLCCLVATVSLVVICSPAPVGAESALITPEDLEFSDPFEITSRIMEIDYGKSMLVVAENEIYVVDLIIGAESVITILSDRKGRPILFDALDRGQMVTVNGILLPDGRIIAEELVLLSRKSDQFNRDSNSAD